MASLKEIKARIASVQSTEKITAAMRMVASAKLHRTQMMTQNFLLYIEELNSIVNSLGGMAEKISGAEHKCVALLPISSSSGLCGAFNSNIVKETFSIIDTYKAKGVEVRLFPIGKKISRELKKGHIDANLDFQLIADGVGKEDVVANCRKLVNFLDSLLVKGEIDGVEFIYHHFVSMGKQVITRDMLALEVPRIQEIRKEEQEYITEPSPEELMAELHPKMLNSKVYSILLDSVTSEHAARMLAMQTADDNAKELLQELTLLYNKSRQQAITNELIDIMGGKTQEG